MCTHEVFLHTTGALPETAPLRSEEVVDLFIGMRRELERLLVSRTGCRHTALDLLQDLYFRVLRIGKAFPSQDDARHYMIRMAINAAIDHGRTEARRAALLEGSQIVFEREDLTPEDHLHNAHHIRQIDAALTELPEKCKQVLFLAQVQGLTHAEIASELGVSRSLVEKYNVLALSHCRAQLLAA